VSFDIERIRKAKRRVAKFVKRNPKRPSPDAVHKLRTGARQLDAVLVALALDGERGAQPLLRRLKKARRLAGKVRDMDVLIAEALDIDRRGEQDCLVRLLEYLGAERDKGARKLRDRIAKRRSKILRDLERSLEQIERVAKRTREEPRDAGPMLGAGVRALGFSSKLSHPGRLTRANLHDYRLQVKELRDVLRLSDRAADTALVQKLGDVKAAIGDWHDWVELTDIAVEALDHRPSCELIKRIKGTRESKYRRALSLTKALIARQLRPRPRKRGKRSSASAPITAPVVEAVAAIVQEGGSEIAH
jgi:CHAD domain-containing protein